MNKMYLKNIMYILIGVVAVVVFFKILPFLILGGFIAYAVLKIVRYFKDKTDGVRFENNLGYNASNSRKVDVEDDIDPRKAIDVDYKDV